MSDQLDRLRHTLGSSYQLEVLVGTGGMASVYRATDVRHNRKVAVKVLHPDLASSVSSERFTAEVLLTASLQHPHILPLHDSGGHDDLLHYSSSSRSGLACVYPTDPASKSCARSYWRTAATESASLIRARITAGGAAPPRGDSSARRTPVSARRARRRWRQLRQPDPVSAVADATCGGDRYPAPHQQPRTGLRRP